MEEEDEEEGASGVRHRFLHFPAGTVRVIWFMVRGSVPDVPEYAK